MKIKQICMTALAVTASSALGLIISTLNDNYLPTHKMANVEALSEVEPDGTLRVATKIVTKYVADEYGYFEYDEKNTPTWVTTGYVICSETRCEGTGTVVCQAICDCDFLNKN
jgi:hypothetical protein